MFFHVFLYSFTVKKQVLQRSDLLLGEILNITKIIQNIWKRKLGEKKNSHSKEKLKVFVLKVVIPMTERQMAPREVHTFLPGTTWYHVVHQVGSRGLFLQGKAGRSGVPISSRWYPHLEQALPR